jgi:dTDP-4-amino-4,6-dideoxygalactose transaminase
MLRDHGQSKKYFHDVEGYNGRLDSIQAGVLSVKLRHLAEWNRKRRLAAQEYDEMFSSVDGVIAPYQPDWSCAVYHLYVIRVQNREGLQKHLAGAKVDTGIHYPLPLYLQKAHANLGYKQGDFPVTERIASEILSLPLYPHLELRQQKRIVHKIAEFLRTSVRVERLPISQPELPSQHRVASRDLNSGSMVSNP